MQLTYRGVAYKYSETSVELPKSARTGKYRGIAINLPSTLRVLRQSLVFFKYRGVDYTQQIGNRHLQPIISAVESESTQIQKPHQSN